MEILVEKAFYSAYEYEHYKMRKENILRDIRLNFQHKLILMGRFERLDPGKTTSGRGITVRNQTLFFFHACLFA